MSYYDIDNYMPILKQMAKDCATGYVLEIGVGQADGSTKAFFEGLADRVGDEPLMISVDQKQDFEHGPLVGWWHFVEGDSTCPTTLGEVLKISSAHPDIIFIDTDHNREQVTKELILWSSVAGPGTTWLFHDTYMYGFYNPMTDAIKEYAAANGWVYDDIDTRAHGLGRMRRP